MKEFLVKLPPVEGWSEKHYIEVITHAFSGWPVRPHDVRAKSMKRVNAGRTIMAARQAPKARTTLIPPALSKTKTPRRATA
jgi:hypothetical protein